MYETILVAVDGSPHAKRAVDAAAALAKLSGGRVIALHVVERRYIKGGVFEPEPEGAGSEILDEAVRDLKDAEVNVEGELYPAVFGHAAEEIVGCAKKWGVDTIVMGTRGLNEFTALVIGSVAHKVLHFAECPVVIVR